MKIFEDPKYDSFMTKILDYLDETSLSTSALVNKRFYTHARKSLLTKVTYKVLDLITQCTKSEIDAHLYLSCHSLNLLCVMETSAHFFPNLVTKIIRPFTALEVVKSLVSLPKEQFDINQQGIIGQSLLHLFIYDIEASKTLIQNGANINAQDEFGFTALHHGIDLHNSDSGILLLEFFKEHKFNFCLTSFRNESVVDILLKKISKTEDINSYTFKMILALPFDDLLNHMVSKKNTHTWLFYQIANAKPQYTKRLKMVLEINQNAVQQNGHVPLKRFCPESIVKQLQLQPKEKHLSMVGGSVLNFLKIGPIPGLKTTLEEFYDCTKKIVGFSDSDMVALLLRHSDVSQSLYMGRTILHFFIVSGDIESVTYLLKSQAKVNHQDLGLNTPLHCFVKFIGVHPTNRTKLLTMVELFEQHKFKFNLTNNEGLTVCELLLSVVGKVTLIEHMRQGLVKLLALTYLNPFDVLNHYQIDDNTLHLELTELLKNQSLSDELVVFNANSASPVCKLLQADLGVELATELASKLNLDQAKHLVECYRKFVICNNLKNEEGFNEFLLTLEERIVKKIDDYEDGCGFEFSSLLFQVLACLFKYAENKPNEDVIIKNVVDKLSPLKVFNDSRLDFAVIPLLIANWNALWFKRLTIKQIALLDKEVVKFIVAQNIPKQVEIVETLGKIFICQPNLAEIDLNYVLSFNSDSNHLSSHSNPNSQIVGESLFKKRLSNDLTLKIFSYLDLDSLKVVSKVDKKFRLLARELLLPKIASQLADLILNTYATEIEGEIYLGYKKLDLLYLFDNKPGFYFKVLKEFIKPFKPVEIVAFLIKHGFDFKVQGSLGQTMLHFVACDIEAVKLLISQGVDVNAQDYHGNTAAHYEVGRSNSASYIYQLLELFGKNKFDFQIKNSSQKRVFDYLFERINPQTFVDGNSEALSQFLTLPFNEILHYLSVKNVTNVMLFEKLAKLKPEYSKHLSEIFNRNKQNLVSNNQPSKNTARKPGMLTDYVDALIKSAPPEKQLFCIVKVLRQALFAGHALSEDVEVFYGILRKKMSPFSHQKILEVLLETLPVNQSLYQNKTLLHYYIMWGDLESIVFLIQKGANINAQDACGRTALHVAVEKSDVNKFAEKLLPIIELFDKHGFKFVLTDSSWLTVCQSILLRFPKQTLSDDQRKLIAKVLAWTYINPTDALEYYQIMDQSLYQEMSNPKPNLSSSKELDLFVPPTFQNKLPQTSDIPTDEFAQKVHAEMQLKLTETDLGKLLLEEQIKIRAFRIIGLITHTRLTVEDDVSLLDTADGHKYTSEDDGLMDFYHESILRNVGDLNLISLINKIFEIGFDVNRPGNFGQTLLHFFAVLNNAEVIALLISKGAMVDAKDKYLETPLMKIINMVNFTDYREDVSVSAIKCLLASGANLPPTIANRSMGSYLVNEFLGSINTEEIINCVAFLLAQLDEDVIDLIYNMSSKDETDLQDKEKLLQKTILYLEEKMQVGTKRHQLSLENAPPAKKIKTTEEMLTENNNNNNTNYDGTISFSIL